MESFVYVLKITRNFKISVLFFNLFYLCSLFDIILWSGRLPPLEMKAQEKWKNKLNLEHQVDHLHFIINSNNNGIRNTTTLLIIMMRMIVNIFAPLSISTLLKCNRTGMVKYVIFLVYMKNIFKQLFENFLKN